MGKVMILDYKKIWFLIYIYCLDCLNKVIFMVN